MRRIQRNNGLNYNLIRTPRFDTLCQLLNVEIKSYFLAEKNALFHDFYQIYLFKIVYYIILLLYNTIAMYTL